MVLHGDFFQLTPDLVTPCDIIVMHNVFEWFGSKKQHQQAWQKAKQLFNKKGLKIVTCPSIEQSLKNAQFDLVIADWVKEIPLEYPNQNHDNDEEQEEEEDNLIHLYEVL